MTLHIGDVAPSFTLRDQHGRSHSLGSARGEHPVLLVFFPFAFTGVCAGELRELRDRQDALDATGAQLLALSCDPMFALRVFADQDKLQFPLLSDFWPHGAVAQAYDAFDEQNGCATRSSFVVDRDGLLRWSVRNPMGEARSVDDYLGVLDQLEATRGAAR